MHAALTLPRGPRANPDWMRSIQVTEVLAELRPTAPWRLSHDPDLLLRGVLGRAMFGLCCVRDHGHCERCDLQDDCEIPTWYEPARAGGHAPRPVIPASITPGGADLTGDEPWRVRLWLMGEAPRPSLLVEGLVRAGRDGLGADRVVHQAARIWVRGAGVPVTVWTEGRTVAHWPSPGRLSDFAVAPADPEGVAVNVRSALRWPEARPDRAPTAGDLLWAAIGRVRQVARAQGQALPTRWEDPRGLDLPWVERRWVSNARTASRGGTQDLSGWVGTVSLGAEVAPWADLLAAAEVLGIGPSVSAGRGRLRLDWQGPR